MTYRFVQMLRKNGKQRVLHFAQNDNQKNKGNSNDKSKCRSRSLRDDS